MQPITLACEQKKQTLLYEWWITGSQSSTADTWEIDELYSSSLYS